MTDATQHPSTETGPTAPAAPAAPAEPSVSVLYPSQPLDPRMVAPFAEVARRSAAPARLWMGHSLLFDTLDTFTYLAGAGYRQPFGTSVSLMASRHPFDAAVRARSAAIATGAPFVAGFGTGLPRFVEAMAGQAWESPLTAAREYLGIVGSLLRGEQVQTSGRYYQVTGALVPLPVPVPPVQVGLGVLRPRMAEVAGEVADVAITWMTPPAYLAETILPALERGAERAGRPRPRVVTVVHAARDTPGRDLPEMAFNAARGHLSAPHYTDMLRRAGVPADAADPRAGAAAIVDAGVFVTGSAEDIAREVAAYHAAGVDEVVINPAGVLFTEGPQPAVDELEAILAAVHAATGSDVPGAGSDLPAEVAR